MLDHFAIFNRGGIVLWERTWEKLKGTPINHLIQTIFLEERSATDSFNYENYGLKWERANEQGLYFVAVYQNILQKNPILDTLIGKVKASFLDSYQEKLKRFSYPIPEFNFDKQFQQLLNEATQQLQEEKQQKQLKTPKPFSETQKGKEIAKSNSKKDVKKGNPELEKQPLAGSKGGPKAPLGKSGKTQAAPQPYKDGQKRPKPQTKWKEDAVDPNELNFCNEADVTADAKEKKIREDSEMYDIGGTTKLEFSESESSEEEAEEKPTQGALGGFMSYLSTFTNKELSDADLAPVLDQFKQALIIKNVAQEIAENLCESVGTSLVGKKLGTFTRVKTTVEEAMSESLTRLLTPKRTIDILRDVQIARREKRPYVMTFVGVNGVGKTTSLAKVVSWLQQNNLKVIIAACDTYRSGAVEQLMVHANNLGVELFQRGYGKIGKVDAANIALQTIEQAKLNGTDVVVIDTSGRMQDNLPLMKDLAKLVDMNEPDLVLFVGEALVGNDSVDQKFNTCLQENCNKSRKVRGIDGIVLTKFDTVDEKVGAAISMVYTTGQPIVFVGVGQKYSDLRVLDVKKIVSILLK